MGDTFVRRVVGAAMLDAGTYEEVEADRTATPQALAVVVFSSLAAGIGAKGLTGGSASLIFFGSTSIIALMAWAAFALVTFEIGARLLPTAETRVDVGELLRTLGFAAAPGLIQVFGVLPGVRTPVFGLAIVWALAVCGLAWILSFILAAVLGLVFGPTLSGF